MELSQLEFLELVANLQPRAAEMQQGRRMKKRLKEVTHEAFAVGITRACHEENVGFATYAMMVSCSMKKQPPSLIALADETGYTYWAIRNQLERTAYFKRIIPTQVGGLIHVEINAEGVLKLARISRRIAKYV